MGHMGVDYVNFGLIDPYQYPKAMFKNFYAVTEGAFDKDLSDKDYNKILNNVCFSDYIDRITFQKQIWIFNEMSSLIKTFYNNSTLGSWI